MNQAATQVPEHTSITVRRAEVHDALDVHAMLANPAVVVVASQVENRSGTSGPSAPSTYGWATTASLDDLYVRASARDRGIGGQRMAALATRPADTTNPVT